MQIYEILGEKKGDCKEKIKNTAPSGPYLVGF